MILQAMPDGLRSLRLGLYLVMRFSEGSGQGERKSSVCPLRYGSLASPPLRKPIRRVLVSQGDILDRPEPRVW